MIDNFSLGLTHLLLIVVAWRLLTRVDLDNEGKTSWLPKRDA